MVVVQAFTPARNLWRVSLHPCQDSVLANFSFSHSNRWKMVSGLMCTMGLNAGNRAHRGRYLPVALLHPLPARADSSKEGRMCQTLAILASPEAEPKRETLWGQDHPSLWALDAVTCDLEQWQPSVAKYWQTCGQEDTSENGREEDGALGHVGHYGAAPQTSCCLPTLTANTELGSCTDYPAQINRPMQRPITVLASRQNPGTSGPR